MTTPDVIRPAPIVTDDTAVFWDGRGRRTPRRPALRGVRPVAAPAAPDVPALPLARGRGRRALGTRHGLQLRGAAPPAEPGVRVPGRHRARRPRRGHPARSRTSPASSRTTSASACRVEVPFAPTADDMAVPQFRPVTVSVVSPQALRDATAIVGVGCTEFSRQRRAHRAAARVRVDHRRARRRGPARRRRRRPGQLHHRPGRGDRARAFGRVRGDRAGRAACRTAAAARWACCSHAAGAVVSGVADVVVAYRAIRARSGATPLRRREDRTEPDVGPLRHHRDAVVRCRSASLTPASWMALNATRYMHDFGVTSDDFGRAVVQLRAYAATNPAAWGYQKPITLDDHQESRWIVEPCIHLFDCCQETDGSVALVITSRERAADLPRAAGAHRRGRAARAVRAGDRVRSLPARPLDHGRIGRAGGAAVRRAAGSRATTSTSRWSTTRSRRSCSCSSRRSGFCGFGEAKDFVADGNLALDGALPCNTNGGLIGEGYIHGLNLVLEATRQLRGDRGQPGRRPAHDPRVVEPDRRHPHPRLRIRVRARRRAPRGSPRGAPRRRRCGGRR